MRPLLLPRTVERLVGSMPRVDGDQSRVKAPASVSVKGIVGKIACSKDFHLVKARDAPVFYKILAQLR